MYAGLVVRIHDRATDLIELSDTLVWSMQGYIRDLLNCVNSLIGATQFCICQLSLVCILSVL